MHKKILEAENSYLKFNFHNGEQVAIKINPELQLN